MRGEKMEGLVMETRKLSPLKHFSHLNFSENASFIKTKLGQMH